VAAASLSPAGFKISPRPKPALSPRYGEGSGCNVSVKIGSPPGPVRRESPQSFLPRPEGSLGRHSSIAKLDIRQGGRKVKQLEIRRRKSERSAEHRIQTRERQSPDWRLAKRPIGRLAFPESPAESFPFPGPTNPFHLIPDWGAQSFLLIIPFVNRETGDSSISHGFGKRLRKPQLISIQVGILRTGASGWREVTTAIFKVTVDKRITLHWLNLEGDKRPICPSTVGGTNCLRVPSSTIRSGKKNCRARIYRGALSVKTSRQPVCWRAMFSSEIVSRSARRRSWVTQPRIHASS